MIPDEQEILVFNEEPKWKRGSKLRMIVDVGSYKICDYYYYY